MTRGLDWYRITVLAGFCMLALLLAAMITNLLTQLQDLSRSAQDNMQWSISQIDTEFANLDAMLVQQIATERYSADEIALRLDITLSRLNIITSGRIAEIFDGAPEAQPLLASLQAFEGRAIALADAPGPLTRADIEDLQGLVSAVRPDVRETALLGVRLGAAQSEARRAEFAAQLLRTGLIAIGLLVLMAILLLLLDRMLARAARRDRALATSSRQLQATVAASLDAIVTANASGEIIDFNASAEHVFGWSRDEILGQTMEATFIPHRMRDAHHNGMRRYLDTGKPRVVDAGRVELAALRKSGEEFPVELNITTAQDGADQVFIAYIRDISERKINEQRLIDARDRAERTDKAKSRFLAVMSHEMRTPLNGILGVLDLLKTTSLDDQQARYARIATSSSEVLLEHVNEALDITRVETGELHLSLQDFDLNALMQGLLDVFDPLAREKNLSIALQIDPTVQETYHGDAGRIRQVLTNLIGNAIKFTDQGGITLRVSGIHGPGASSLRFEVEDTGIGIPADRHEQIFEDFFALAKSEGRQTRGDGLGLSISRRIARAMDGDISLHSTEHAGSVFVLTLPLQRAKNLRPAPAAEQDAPDRPATSCSVLIVEDNSINRSVLTDMLTAKGHRVEEAVNGADCLEKAQGETFDVIFMDISMPVMDGIEATERLRQGDSPNRKTRIVGLTAHGREEYRERAVAAGMDRFHTKPIRLDALHSILAEINSERLTRLDTSHFPEALTEMIEVLGPDKVADTARAFLGELEGLVGHLRSAEQARDTDALAAAAHKVKGAASLLGQVEVQGMLADLEALARAGDMGEPETWATDLTGAAAGAKATIDQAIKLARQRP
ncbi:ATP-binding protein [Tateyamaria sp. SN6-1]|uniref:hybrid sensor histidine kinase/response regulator n=1 Tax=Tateyamaria sp. SN6-1 TaxID=3092148 RepID=UPI0039F4A7A8